MVLATPVPFPPLRGFLIAAAALALTACGDKTSDTPPPPAVTAPAVGAPADATTAAADPHSPDHDPETMAQHHRQQMDHEAMRQGGASADPAAKPDPGSMNAAAPMKDM